LALIIVLLFGIESAGGVGAVVENAKSLPGYLSFSATFNPETGKAAGYGFITVISTLAWGLGYFGMPHILLRFMAIEDENNLKTSRRVASIWVVLSMGIAILIGIVGLAMSKAGSIVSLQGSGSETIIVKIADVMSRHSVLLAVAAGIVLSGILAATMSTADSQLLAASSSVSENIIHEFFHMEIAEKALLKVARVSLLIIAVIGVAIAWNPDSSVFGIVSFAWAGFGAAFGPVVLLALFWRRSNMWGALFGMLSGGVMIFVWKFAIRTMGGAWDIYELLPAFVVAFLVNILVSLCTPAPSKEVTDVFDEMKKTK
jgi:sodium/proline symporter